MTAPVDVASAGCRTAAFMCRSCGHLLTLPACPNLVQRLCHATRVHHKSAHPGTVGELWLNIDKAADDYTTWLEPAFRGVS